MKRVVAITILNYLVSGALTLLIPLLLLARDVNIAEIGVILSILPLIFLGARMILAAIADRVGWSPIFFLVNWPTNLISTLIYLVAASTPAFTLGKVVEGLKESSFWAVIRTAVFSLAPSREGQEATRINAIIWIATAAGSAFAGLGIALVGFTSTIGILAIASALIGIPSVSLWKNRSMPSKPQKGSVFSALSPRGRSRTFWFVSVAITFNSLAVYPLVVLLLPAFMDQQLRYSYIVIGILFMIYNLVAAIVAILTLKRKLTWKRALLQSTIILVATIFLASSGTFFPALLFVLAFARGLSVAFFEYAVAKVTKNSENVSVDVGLLHAPMRFAEFASVLAAGFFVQAVGYGPAFFATGIAFVIFSAMTLRVLSRD